MPYLMILALLAVLPARAAEKAPEPITIHAPRPLVTIDPSGKMEFQKGVEPEDVITVLVGELSRYDQALKACHGELEAKAKKKTK